MPIMSKALLKELGNHQWTKRKTSLPQVTYILLKIIIAQILGFLLAIWTILSVLFALTCESSIVTHGLTSFTISNFQMRTLRHREVEYFTPNHTALAAEIQQQVSQCPFLASSLVGGGSINWQIVSVTVVTKEMHGVGAREGHKTQPSLNLLLQL